VIHCPFRVFCQQVYVLLNYFITGLCCLRVDQHCSIYKSIGFIQLNKLTYLNTFMIQLAQRCSDNGGPTVRTLVSWVWCVFSAKDLWNKFKGKFQSSKLSHVYVASHSIKKKVGVLNLFINYFPYNRAGRNGN